MRGSLSQDTGIPGRQQKGVQASAGSADHKEDWETKLVPVLVYKMHLSLPLEVTFLPCFWLRLLVPLLLICSDSSTRFEQETPLSPFPDPIRLLQAGLLFSVNSLVLHFLWACESKATQAFGKGTIQ